MMNKSFTEIGHENKVRKHRESIYILNGINGQEEIEFDKWGGGEFKLNIDNLEHKGFEIKVFIPYLTMTTLEKAIIFKKYLNKKYKYVKVKLIIGYFSYSRQERETEKEPMLSNMILDILEANFCDTCIIDYHNVESIMSKKYPSITTMSALKIIGNETIKKLANAVIVAPDKGAKLRNDKLDIRSDIIIDKVRQDGEVRSTISHINDEEIHKYSNFIILDDICDGGRTFANIAKLLKDKYPNSTITLCVTHAIIPYGVRLLVDNGIDRIITTNTCLPDYYNDYVKVVNLFSKIK